MTWQSDGLADRAAQLIDRACDVGFVVFALLTITYHVAASAHWSLRSWLVTSVVGLLLVGAAALVVRRRTLAASGLLASPQVSGLRFPPPLAVALLVVGAVAAVVCQSTATDRLWPITWLMLAAGTGLGLALAWRRSRAPVASDPPASDGERSTGDAHDLGRGSSAAAHLLAFVVTVGAGVMALFVVRPDADDVYYANRAVWVAQHGAIPLRDTMFGNQVFPAPAGEKVPVASIEAVQGAVARALGVPAPSVVWLLTTALASMLACWMLWRLVRSWVTADRAALVFAVACVFLAWDAWNSRSIGNFHLVRLWQGKSVFVSCLVPAIYVWLTRWFRLRRRTDALMLFVLGVCGVGLTSSAVFLVPMLALVGGVAGVLRRERALLGPALLALYPVLTGIAIVALERGEGAPAKFQSAPQVLAHLAVGTGVIGLVGWLALLIGPWCAGGAWPRTLALSSVGVLAVVTAPGVHAVIGRVSGAGPVMWRETWIVPLPILAGLLAVVPLPRLAPLPSRVSTAVPALLVVAAQVAAGTPLWASSNHARIAASPAWKAPQKGELGAAAILRHGTTAGLLLAPASVMSAIAQTTTRTYSVVPRDIYLVQLTSGDAQGRRLLLEWVSRQRDLSSSTLKLLLSELDVREVCLSAQSRHRLHAVANVGYTRAVRADWLTCRRLPGTAPG